MEKFKKYYLHILFGLLFFVSIFVWNKVFSEPENNIMKVVFLDVGQGDSIYIEAPNKTQILIDGGPDLGVLSELQKVMPFGDRSLDFVIATHADMDHIGGLLGILENYEIGGILENGLEGDSQLSKNFSNKINELNVPRKIANNNLKIILDQNRNIYFDILFPDRDVSNFDSNDASIVGRLVYGEKSFLFTGDASIFSEVLMHNSQAENLDSDVLKLGHHGSKTSSSELFLKDVSPQIAIISAGKNNRYKHPNVEVINRLDKLKIPYLNTAESGSIIFETNGQFLNKK